MIFAMFPGQGSQYPGMGKELLSEFPCANMVFEEAEDTIGVSLRKLCVQAASQELALTFHAQPCILTMSMAIFRVLQEEMEFSPDLCAGHSLGEYSALVASGVISLSTAVRLVYSRGRFMQEAVPAGEGAMAAIFKLSKNDVENICAEVSFAGSIVELANENTPDQMVVSGHASAVDRLRGLLRDKKCRVVRLPVSAPFHSRLMRPARQNMMPLLQQTKFAFGQFPIVANIDGVIAEPYEAHHLIEQIDSPVLWVQTMQTAHNFGVESCVEIGPARVLTGLAQKTIKGRNILATDSLKQSMTSLLKVSRRKN